MQIDFINKFVLPEEKIDVAHLRENIEILSEFEALLDRARRQYKELVQITDVHEKILKKEYDITVNDILLTMANLEALRQEVEESEREIRLKQGAIESNRDRLLQLDGDKRTVEEQIVNINVAIQSNSSQKMLESASRRETELKQKKLELEEQEKRLHAILQKLKIYGNQLNQLLDKYEKSKTFLERNQVNQSFSKLVVELFPKYGDDAEYEFFCDVNEALEEMQKRGLIELSYQRGKILDRVRLNPEQLEACYSFLGRIPKKDENIWFERVWSEFADCEVLKKYETHQRELLGKNRQVEYYKGNHAEQLSSAASALLFAYGDYQEKENVMEECGVVQTPTYVCIKGRGRLVFPEQTVDLTKLPGDIAVSTHTLRGLQRIVVDGECIVTVENLTSFHDITDEEAVVVYLGGFHNKTKREFLKRMYAQNPDKTYLHFGDIDAGGFLILEHLRRKTGIPFKTLCMDVKTLQHYQAQTKALEGTDRKRLQKLMDTYPEHRETVQYMLENNCKLEQEAVILSNPMPR